MNFLLIWFNSYIEPKQKLNCKGQKFPACRAQEAEGNLNFGDLDYYLDLYKENGYIMELRKHVGHATIMCAVGGVIIENEKNEILLQKRRDNNCWGIIGGAMESGESIQETVAREAYEEAGMYSNLLFENQIDFI